MLCTCKGPACPTHTYTEVLHEWVGGQGDPRNTWIWSRVTDVVLGRKGLEPGAESLVSQHGAGKNEGRENGVGAGVVLMESRRRVQSLREF